MLTLSPREHFPDQMTIPSLSPAARLQLQDMIVALATPPGPGARAILRLTGPDCWKLIQPLLIDHATIKSFKPGRFDAALRLPDFFSPIPVHLQMGRSPRTYTGQDLIEIHLISSPPLVQALLDHLIERGARLAQPGEFTLRAFLAGKLDLTQAEAVLTLSSSSDPQELRTALAQLAGGLARPLDHLREELLALLAEVEAGLDFAEEDLAFIENSVLVDRIQGVHSALAKLQAQLHERGQSKAALRVVLAGSTNVGKSSLFNALLGRPAALVSPRPGTTRDYLTGTTTVQGVTIELVDTAGREDALDLIQVQAQSARKDQLKGADLILLCFDSQVGVQEEDAALLTSLSGNQPILVATKGDLLKGPVTQDAILTSTVTGAGLATLRLALAERARLLTRPAMIAPSLTRCRNHIDRALVSLEQAEDLAREGTRMELVAAELRSVLDQIGAMVGAVYTNDLLDRIFSQFCIGK
jgi:tRNA modification GTPase